MSHTDEICSVIDKIRKKQPLIHCITNPISINQCANAILAVGARPIMAEHPGEVSQITETASCLVLNLGNITDVRMEAMEVSSAVAGEKAIPSVIDAVGISCSDLRRGFLLKLLKKHAPTLIKGNYSEIAALYTASYRSAGVDSENIGEDYIIRAAAELAKNYNTIILASGKKDIITDGKTLIIIKNGTKRLADITGTGCMLGALCGCCVSVSQTISAAAAACAIMGIAGELSKDTVGNGSFFVKLMDNISLMDGKNVPLHLDMEVKNLEEI